MGEGVGCMRNSTVSSDSHIYRPKKKRKEKYSRKLPHWPVTGFDQSWEGENSLNRPNWTEMIILKSILNSECSDTCIHTHMFNALLSVRVCVCVCLTTQMCSTLSSPMDCSSPGFSVHGISQARILEWVAIFYFRRSSQPRNWTPVDSIGRWTLNHWAIWEISFLFFGILVKTKKADGNLVH